MKKIIMLTLGLVFSFNAFGDESRADQSTLSPYTQICQAALQSKEAMKVKARELNIGRREQKKIVCNEMSLYDFVEAHQENMQEWSIATVQ